MDQEREDGPPPSIGQVAGKNLRRLRKDIRWTQDALAGKVVASGLNWKRSNIADLESGRRETIDVGTLLILATALSRHVSAFFEGDGDVLLTPRADYPEHAATMTRADIRNELRGEGGKRLRLIGQATARAASQRMTHLTRTVPAEADIALAERLSVDPWKVINAAEALWGKSLTEERDRRVKELGELPIGERQARQGHITRELTAELTKWMNEGEEPGGDG